MKMKLLLFGILTVLAISLFGQSNKSKFIKELRSRNSIDSSLKIGYISKLDTGINCIEVFKEGEFDQKIINEIFREVNTLVELESSEIDIWTIVDTMAGNSSFRTSEFLVDLLIENNNISDVFTWASINKKNTNNSEDFILAITFFYEIDDQIVYAEQIQASSLGGFVQFSNYFYESPMVEVLLSTKKEFELILYPNPTSEEIYIGLEEGLEEVRILDLQGKVVYARELMKVRILNVKIDHLESGIYMVSVYNKKMNQQLTQRLVVNH